MSINSSSRAAPGREPSLRPRNPSSSETNDQMVTADRAGRRKESRMLSRSPNTLTHLSRRAHAQRRLRRSAVSRQVLCSTNGCPTFMEMDAIGHTARCPICGSVRRISPAPRPN